MLGNLFRNTAMPADGGEIFETLLAGADTRVERIVSHGQSSPPGFWYDQAQPEWVALLEGEALLRFEDEPEPRHLIAGDWISIAARRRHRIEWTIPDRPTVWLAVHLTATRTGVNPDLT